MAERPQPQPYGTGERKDGTRTAEDRPAQMPGGQQRPSTSPQSPYRRP